jgi:hypothetical protein
MDETIPILFAVQQEIKLRKNFQLILICTGIGIGLTAIASFFGITLPVGLLGVMLVIYFYVINKKEIARLGEKYDRK